MDASGSSAHDYTVFEGEHEYKRHTKGWILSTKFRRDENFVRRKFRTCESAQETVRNLRASVISSKLPYHFATTTVNFDENFEHL